MENVTMPSVRAVPITLATGVGVSGILLLTLAVLSGLPLRCAPGTTSTAVRLPAAPPPTTPAEATLRHAAEYRLRARLAVQDEMEALEAWDPRASAGINWEVWRLQELARDKSGNLRRARKLAQQAAVLARTSDETRRILTLQLLIDHESGRHDLELQRAQALYALAPGDTQARAILRRARRCRDGSLAP